MQASNDFLVSLFQCECACVDITDDAAELRKNININAPTLNSLFSLIIFLFTPFFLSQTGEIKQKISLSTGITKLLLQTQTKQKRNNNT